MYMADNRDAVVELPGLPQSSTGAPVPLVLADEHHLVVAYEAEPLRSPVGAGVVHVVDPAGQPPTIVLIEFLRYDAYYHGPPDDESLHGHPLHSRGLEPYGAFVVNDSSWIRSLEQMNRVHARHDPQRYDQRRHFILTFHDSTFECIAEDHVVSIHQGSISVVLPEMVRRLGFDPKRFRG